ncbi:hypothetical protein HK096_004771 [Nowakowskiella sp. JEL0078]|nr:hypothetical protein HK096_004771 [Nowakowskiella sp. JEL0078]
MLTVETLEWIIDSDTSSGCAEDAEEEQRRRQPGRVAGSHDDRRPGPAASSAEPPDPESRALCFCSLVTHPPASSDFSSANDVAKQANRKVISSADVFKALEIIDFDEFVPGLRDEFTEYQKTLKAKKVASLKKKRTSDTVIEQVEGDSAAIASEEPVENEEEILNVDELDGIMDDDDGNDDDDDEMEDEADS